MICDSLCFSFTDQNLGKKVKPTFLLGFLESVLEFLKLSKEEDINGIITRTELIERLEAKKTQVKLSAKVSKFDCSVCEQKYNDFRSKGTRK